MSDARPSCMCCSGGLWFSLAGLFVCAGCVTVPPITASSVAAYRDVRSGHTLRGETANHLFCAENGGVEVYRTRSADGADWADKVRDSWIRDAVIESVKRDPTLRDANIDVQLDAGEAFLTGTVPSARSAVRAADEVLAIGGVVAVHTQLRSPDLRVATIQTDARCF